MAEIDGKNAKKTILTAEPRSKSTQGDIFSIQLLQNPISILFGTDRQGGQTRIGTTRHKKRKEVNERKSTAGKGNIERKIRFDMT